MKNLTLVTLFFTFLSSRGNDSLVISKDFYLDGYYAKGLTQNAQSDFFGTTQLGRIFYGYNDQFALGMAQGVISANYNKFFSTIDMAFGPTAKLANYGNAYESIFIKQAFISYATNSKLSFDFGQFGTHIGYEVIETYNNANHSLSYLFGNGPFYHTGAKANLSINDKASVMVGAFNGWDEIEDENFFK